ncbi:MAG: CoA transferase, partial [Gammaproteobacteria bacterium]
ADHPHNQHRGTFITVDGITQPAPSPRFSRTKTAQPTPPEAAGNSTYQVLSHWGFSDNKIKNLEAAGAIGKTKK